MNQKRKRRAQPRATRPGSKSPKQQLGFENDDPRVPSHPIDLIHGFLRYFQVQKDEKGVDAPDPRLKLALPVPTDTLEELATRFHRFLFTDCSLDLAFGGQIGRSRQKRRMTDEAWRVAACIQKYREDATKLPRKDRGGSTPFEIAVAKTAEELNFSEEKVRSLYKQTAPPWK